MIFLSICLLWITTSNSIHTEEHPKELQIVMFTFCLRSHLRPITSIAQELSLRPYTNVTVIVNSDCKELLASRNYNFNIEFVNSRIDNWNELHTVFDGARHNALYEDDILELFIPK